MDHVTIYLLYTYYRLARICDARYEIKPSKSAYYIFLSLVEIYRNFYPISFRLISFRFVSFDFVSLRLVSFRFVALRCVFISFRTLQLPNQKLFRKKIKEKLLRASKPNLCVVFLFAHMSQTGNNLNSDELARENLTTFLVLSSQ